MRCFQLTDLLSDLEALSEEMNKRRIHVVDAHPKPQQLIGHRVTHGAQPNQLDLPHETCRVGRCHGRRIAHRQTHVPVLPGDDRLT
jgi:hypothetical protein